MLADLRVCFVGDSYVAGVGDPEHLGWVGRVAARTERAGQPLTSYALGVRGQTSRDVAQRWHAECAPRLPPSCTGRVVLAVGVNDTTLEDGTTRVTAPDSAAHLARLLRDVRAAAWPALVVGPPPVDDPEQNERVGRLERAFSSVCAASGVGFVPVFDELLADTVWTRQVAAGDGAHPAAGGYQRLADLVWSRWEDWITAAGP